MKRALSFRVNGEPVAVHAKTSARLIDVLRGELGLLGTKEGCGNGECGACTVLVDGLAINSCLYPAAEIEGRSVTTVEGLVGPGGELSALQKALAEHGGVQCGFCTPGMVMSAEALLRKSPMPNATEIRDALRGNLCRCTGYQQIVEAVQAAAAALAAPRSQRGGKNV